MVMSWKMNFASIGHYGKFGENVIDRHPNAVRTGLRLSFASVMLDCLLNLQAVKRRTKNLILHSISHSRL